MIEGLRIIENFYKNTGIFLDIEPTLQRYDVTCQYKEYFPVPVGISGLVKRFDELQENHINHVSTFRYPMGLPIDPRVDPKEWGDDTNIIILQPCTLVMHGEGPGLRDDYHTHTFDLGMNDLVILSGEARYSWKYELLPNGNHLEFIMLRKKMIAGAPIKGLMVYPNFITAEDEKNLILQARTLATDNSYIKSSILSKDDKDDGITMFHGCFQDNLDEDKDKRVNVIGAMYPLTRKIADRIEEKLGTIINHLIFNIYQKTKVAPHIDSVDFGNFIASIILLEDAPYYLFNAFGDQILEIVPRFALVVMSSESRYQWKHAVPPPKGPWRSSAIFRKKIGYWGNTKISPHNFEVI